MKTIQATGTSKPTVRRILQEKINCETLLDSVPPVRNTKTALEAMTVGEKSHVRRLVSLPIGNVLTIQVT